jgi:hypothetical protein
MTIVAIGKRKISIQTLAFAAGLILMGTVCESARSYFAPASQREVPDRNLHADHNDTKPSADYLGGALGSWLYQGIRTGADFAS